MRSIRLKTHCFPAFFWILLFLFGGGLPLLAQQSEFSFYKYEIKDNQFNIYLKAISKGRTERLNTRNLTIYEKIDGVLMPDPLNQLGSRIEIKEQNRQASNTRSMAVLFVLDAGPETPRPLALEMLQTALDSLSSRNPDAQFFLRVFADSIGSIQPITPGDIQARASGMLPPLGAGADLYSCLFHSIRELKKVEAEKRVVILISAGDNLPPASGPADQLQYEIKHVKNLLATTDRSFLLFPIGIGPKASERTSVFSTLIGGTENQQDTFSLFAYPREIGKALNTEIDLAYNNVLQLQYPRPVFRGEKRQIIVKWTTTGQEAKSEVFTRGTHNTPDNSLLTPVNWWVNLITPFLVGISLVLGTLFIFKEAVPFVGKRSFRSQYVSQYTQQDGMAKKRDPMTGDYIKDKELVVTKCPRVTCTLATWEYVGNKCPEYPRCMRYTDPCDGIGAPLGIDNFFAGKGVFRRFNWLWFGMLGGFIAWLLHALFNLLDFTWYRELLAGLLGNLSSSEAASGEQLLIRVTDWANETLFGMALGTGIAFTLSWVEERFQPRKISWRRIALRTVAGMLASFVIFFGGFYLFTSGMADAALYRFLVNLVIWMLFGLTMGLILSFDSSISISRGMLSGLLASLIAFLAYMAMAEVGDFVLANMLSFIVLGSILGFTIVTVVTTLEDFELEYLQPDEFRSVNPISKWLKAGIDIYIGREPGSYVYIKWNDPDAAPRHARLTLNQGVVFIQPLADIYINGRPVPLQELTRLNNGDMIKLGRESTTIMRFIEKRKSAN
ncbi:MAG: FHA domain-containing protein [Saprospiraceae bacterium]|nr:FHA domain-containing protein [Saprospiraceae bacterium]